MTLRQLITRARKHYPTSRHNQRAWIRSIQQLGSKWLLAAPIDRSQKA